MQAKQKVLVVVLVLLSLAQQGVRWYGKSRRIQGPQLHAQTVAAAEAEAPVAEEVPPGQAHCQLVHVNTAGMAELQTLPGIGPVLAERIIIARREKPFLEKRDLLRVPGIGEKRLAQIVDLICLYLEEHEETG